MPYGEQSFDMVRLNGAWVAFPLKSQNCNEVRRQKKKKKMKARDGRRGAYSTAGSNGCTYSSLTKQE